MIAIIDNGKDYSDHEIHFVECSPHEAIVLEWLFAKVGGGYHQSSVVATAEHVNWREDGTCPMYVAVGTMTNCPACGERGAWHVLGGIKCDCGWLPTWENVLALYAKEQP